MSILNPANKSKARGKKPEVQGTLPPGYVQQQSYLRLKGRLKSELAQRWREETNIRVKLHVHWQTNEKNRNRGQKAYFVWHVHRVQGSKETRGQWYKKRKPWPNTDTNHKSWGVWLCWLIRRKHKTKTLLVKKKSWVNNSRDRTHTREKKNLPFLCR